MKKYSVIVSEHGSVGRPQGFNTLPQALESYAKHPKAVLVKRTKSLREVVLDSKGLTEEEVNALMGK